MVSIQLLSKILVDVNFSNQHFFCSGGDAVPETVVRTDIKGRLLTPAEGCGFSKVPNTRIVGGSPAKKGEYKQSSLFGTDDRKKNNRKHFINLGAWPWIALLGHKDKMHIDFSCGKSKIKHYFLHEIIILLK